MIKVGWTLAVAVVLGGSAHADEQSAAMSPNPFPEVADTSFLDGKGDRMLRLSLVIPAPRAAVWRAFSTGEGYRTWATPVAAVDLRIGGLIETSYDSKARLGDAQNIKNQILAYEPERMMVFRNVQAPANLPGRDRFGDIVSVAQFEDAGPGATRVTLSSIGYRPGEPYDTLYRRFSWGNAYSLMKLKESFVVGPIDWAAAAAREAAASASAAMTEGR